MIQFEFGRKYSTRSIGDSDCWWHFTVTKRTAKSVWLTCHDRGEFKNRRFVVNAHNGVE